MSAATTQPRERGILYQGTMVRSLLAELKTQTRRPVKGWALEWLSPPVNFTPEYVADRANNACPYGYPGDHLWVRETFFAWGRWETRYSAKKKRDEWHFIDMTMESKRVYHYAMCDSKAIVGAKDRGGVLPVWWKRPAIFMPRAASRILLEITDVRVERLQDISQADAMAEGVWTANAAKESGCIDRSPGGGNLNHVGAYRTLWEEINGKGSWDLSPLVWVVKFKVVQP